MPSAQVVKEIVARIDSLDQMMKDMLLFARPPQAQTRADRRRAARRR